jgi:cysteine-rich repeat protein
MKTTTRTLLSLLSGALLALGACSSNGPATNPECNSGDKCDDPGTTADRECREECDGGDSTCLQTCRDGRALQHCEARRSDALNSAQKAFTKDNIRWACADVEGVNTNRKDDRGQEYCEYYAAIQLPPETEGGALPTLVTTGRAESNDSLSLDLKEDQIFALEDEPDAIVGQCVFTSWHSDIQESLPVCNGSEVGCPKLTLPADTALPSWYSRNELDLMVNRDIMRMKGSINSNVAASDLFEKCMTGPLVGDPADAEDPLNDNYLRGCMHTYELFKTEWRRSDPSICAAGGRLAECGCGVDTDGDGIANITDPKEISVAVVPRQPDTDGTLRLRGFHLGTWSDMNALPPGCRYIETGDADSTSTLVACDLTANDVLTSANDPKQRCRDKYGDNVVVHVPVPAAAIVCAPPADGVYTDSCGELPWVIGAEGAAPPPAGVCGDGTQGDGEGCDDGNTTAGDGCSATCTVEEPVVCEFDPCVDGSTPPDSCDADACVVAVCGADSFCCETAWDNLCIGAVDTACSVTCNETSF